MEAKKIVVPVIFAVVIAGLAFMIYYMSTKDHRFTIPGRSTMETEIKKLGYDVGELDKDLMKFVGVEPFTKIYAASKKTSEADANAEEKDVSFTFFEYNDWNDAAKTMSNYYSNAVYLKKYHKGKGKVRTYYDAKKNRAYAVYDLQMDSDGFLENFVMVENSGNLSLGFAQKKIPYMYGGIYMDGKRVVSITTTNKQKAYDIGRVLEDLGLPKP